MTGGIVVVVAGGGLLLMAWMFSQTPGLPFRVAVWVLLAIVAACALGLGWMAIKWAQNAVDPVRITDEGIDHAGRVHPWDAVWSLGGIETAGGRVVINYRLRTPADRPHAWLHPAGQPRHLLTSPPLTRDEFDDLMGTLTQYLPPRHPHVRLDPKPRWLD